jgi:formylglycine-generating enzyme required for sulfatase activity
MPSDLDLTVHPLNRWDNKGHLDMPELYAAQAPFRPARGRSLETLVIHLAWDGFASLSPKEHKKLLIHLADIYYKTPGSTTSAMKQVTEDLNDILIERNAHKATHSDQFAGLLTLVVIHDRLLHLSQSGPTHAFLITSGGTKHFYLSNLAWRGLGFSRTPNIRFHQMKIEPGDALLISASPPQSWMRGDLDESWGKPLEGTLKTIGASPDPSLQGAVVKIDAGTGNLYFSQTSDEDVITDEKDSDDGIEKTIGFDEDSQAVVEVIPDEETKPSPPTLKEGEIETDEIRSVEEITTIERSQDIQDRVSDKEKSDQGFEPFSGVLPSISESLSPDTEDQSVENSIEDADLVTKEEEPHTFGRIKASEKTRFSISTITRRTWSLVGFLLILGSILGWIIVNGGFRPNLLDIPTEIAVESESPTITKPILTEPVNEVSSMETATEATQPPVSSEVTVPTTSIPTSTSVSILNVGITQVSPVDGMVLVYIPAGGFFMGGANDDGNIKDDELPSHYVNLKGYWIDQNEVTNAQYALCVADKKCDKPYSQTSFSRNDYYYSEDYADFPVIYVSWYNAVSYCEWAGRRLPTEAEWEKAARGDDGRIFPWGDEIDCALANFSGCSGDTVKIGSYPEGASPYGLLDMAGNVWEWVADYYYIYYYASSPLDYPQGPESGAYRVIRGGSWSDEARMMRTSSRFYYFPDSSRASIGFRCVGISSN